MHAIWEKSKFDGGSSSNRKCIFDELVFDFFELWLTVSANPIAVPIRWLGTVAFVFIALVNRDAVPPARADGGRVDIGRAEVSPLFIFRFQTISKLMYFFFWFHCKFDTIVPYVSIGTCTHSIWVQNFKRNYNKY